MKNNVLEYIYNNIDKTIKYSPNDDDTLIGLPHKYTTPCASDMFQEIYYWDTYFTNVGLILMGKTELAKSNVDNMLFLIEKYGFMPNGNRTFYLNRSQPPFLSKMVRDSLWRNIAPKQAKELDEVMRGTVNAYITDYRIITDMVRAVVYENGSCFIVNYGDADFDYNGIIIESLGYKKVDKEVLG